MTSHTPDQHFLRMVSDHHLGMMAMAHAAMERNDAAEEVRAKARQIDRKQHEEAREMTSMLEREFGDRYEPQVMPNNERMIERVRSADGSAVERTFYETVVEHHQHGLEMMDRELPSLTNPAVRRMAERMKDDQQREIEELCGKLSAR